MHYYLQSLQNAVPLSASPVLIKHAFNQWKIRNYIIACAILASWNNKLLLHMHLQL